MTKVPFLERIRQNHALEHATMHILSERPGSPCLIGRSDWQGFTLYGDVGTQDVLRAALEAVARLRGGETWLAVHPHCSTNLAVAALLVGTAAYATAVSARGSRLRGAAVMVVAMAATVAAARPLGIVVQQHITTTCMLDGVHIPLVRRELKGNVVVHRVFVECNR